MATNPPGLDGALYDTHVTNDLGALNTLIGFEGVPADGSINAPEDQTAVLHRIGHSDTDVPGVVNYVEPDPVP